MVTIFACCRQLYDPEKMKDCIAKEDAPIKQEVADAEEDALTTVEIEKTNVKKEGRGKGEFYWAISAWWRF